jgi:hypothetical protein
MTMMNITSGDGLARPQQPIAGAATLYKVRGRVYAPKGVYVALFDASLNLSVLDNQNPISSPVPGGLFTLVEPNESGFYEVDYPAGRPLQLGLGIALVTIAPTVEPWSVSVGPSYGLIENFSNQYDIQFTQ